MKISMQKLYNHYKSLRMSHIEIIRKIRADLRLNSLEKQLA